MLEKYYLKKMVSFGMIIIICLSLLAGAFSVSAAAEENKNTGIASVDAPQVKSEELENVALNKSVTASSNAEPNPPERAVDGKGISESGGWVASNGIFPQWLKVDLGDIHELSRIKQTFADTDNSTFKYKIQGSNNDLEWDSEDWEMLADRTENGVTTATTITEQVSGSYRYIIFMVTDINNGHWANSRAFEVYGEPVSPIDDIEDVVKAVEAAGITEPKAGDSKLTLPTVPKGFTVSIKSALPEGIIGHDGMMTIPDEQTEVEVVLAITKISDNTTVETEPLTVTVKGAGDLAFQIDAASQADGSSVYRHIDNMMCISNAHPDEQGKKILNGKIDFQDDPEPEFTEGWGDERYNEVFEYALYNWAVTSNDERPDGGYTEVDGKVGYIDWNGLKDQCRIYVDGGLKPWLMFQGVPEPISAGGYRSGPYSYNLSQPADYDKWFQYMQAVMQYLVDEFGAEEVSTWGFCFWSEAFHQFDAYEPETGSSTTEFIKMYDYWNAALDSVLGEGKAYTGIYLETPQNGGVPEFLKHCAKGTNYYSGETGSRLGWIGYSNWASGGYGSNANIINANNFISFYEMLDNQVKKYSNLDNTDFVMVESGYLVMGDGGIPDLTYAENYGASYYAWRMDNYTKLPRLKSCISFYNMTTGEDVYESGRGAKSNWLDNMLVPSFHSWKLSQMMANERRLPVDTSGKAATASNLVGCIPTAAGDDENTHRILLYNANADPNLNAGEKITVKLDGIPSDNVKITKYLIDETHNNWWTDWTNYRQQENIPYIMRGHGVGLNQEQAAWHKTVWETTDDAGYQKWLAKIPEYKEKQDLQVTTPKTTAAVTDGSVTLTETLPGHSVMYIEITYDEADSEYGENLDFETGDLKNWSITGLAQSASVARNGQFGAKLTSKPNQDAFISKTISGLEPNTSYVLYGYGKPLGSGAKYRLFAHNPGESKNRANLYSQGLLSSFGNWNSMSVTKKTDEKGELVIGCWVVSDSADQTVYFDDLKLQRAGNGMPSLNEKVNAAYKKLIYASSEKPGYEAENAIDGKDTTAWIAGQTGTPQWLMIDLCGTYSLEKVSYTFADEDGRNYKYIIEGSMDKESWTTLVDRTEEGVSQESEITERVKGICRYVRIAVTEVTGDKPIAFSEFEVYGTQAEDLAFGKPAKASGANRGNEPGRAFDGTTGWVANSAEYPHWLQVDLLAVYDLHTIKQTFGDDDNSTFKYYIEGSLDNKNWDILVDNRQDGVITRDTITASVSGKYRYVKLTVTHINNDHWANSRAFQIYGDPVIDETGLEQSINAAKAMKQGEYSEESWKVFTEVLTESQALLGRSAVQEQADEMLKKLQNAIDRLETKSYAIIKSAETGAKIVVQNGKTTAKAGEKIGFTVELSNKNKELKSVIVKDHAGKILPLSTTGGGYQFTMPGQAVTITVTLKDKKVDPPKPPTPTIKVKRLAFKTPGYTITKKGQKVKLAKYLVVTPENAANKTMTWKSSNKKIATVDSKGVVTFKLKKGKATITATARDGSGKKAKITVVYGKKIAKIKMNVNKLTLKKGKSKMIKAQIISPKKPAYKKILWKSSNTKVATVTSKGKIKARKKGSVKITALAGDGSGKKAVIKLKVK